MAWIYQTETIGEARIRVAIVDHPGEADLCVYLVNSIGLASGDSYWFVDKSRQSARTWVYFTSRGMAQVKICFVKNRGMAGWNKSHPLEGKFR